MNKETRDPCAGQYCGGGDRFVMEVPDATCNNFIAFHQRGGGVQFEYAAKASGTIDMDFGAEGTTFYVSFRAEGCDNLS